MSTYMDSSAIFCTLSSSSSVDASPPRRFASFIRLFLPCMSFLLFFVVRYSVFVHCTVRLSTGVGAGVIALKDLRVVRAQVALYPFEIPQASLSVVGIE